MRTTSNSGFSLIQMAMILAVGSLLLVSLLPGGQIGSDPEKVIITMQRMQKIEEATRAFMIANQRRPCPADASQAIGTQYFGMEAQLSAGVPAAGDCVLNGILKANFPPAASPTTYSVAGGVPTRSLGLSDEYAMDGYGHRITYMVDRRATNAQTCRDLQSQGQPGVIRIADTETSLPFSGNSYSAATYFKDYTMWGLISYGKDGEGAFPEQGNSSGGVTSQITGTNLGVDKIYNAFCHSGCGVNASYLDTLVQRSPDPNTTAYATTRFDDIVWYLNATKNTCCLGPMCDQGFRSIAQTAGNKAGYSVAMGDVNGDGIQDIIIGAPGANAVYVIFGRLTGWPVGGLSTATPLYLNGAGTMLNTSATATSAITGISQGMPGVVTSAAFSPAAGSYAYFPSAPYGASTPIAGMTQLNGNCYKISGAAKQLEDMLGNNLSTNPYFFTAYTSGGTVLNSCGVVISGGVGVTNFGNTLAVGDVNGDTYDDIVIGGTTTISGITTATYWVVFGSPTIISTTTALLSLSPSAGSWYGLYVTGTTNASGAPGPITIGDVNGDGINDIIVAGDNGTTNAYVLFGTNTVLGSLNGPPWTAIAGKALTSLSSIASGGSTTNGTTTVTVASTTGFVTGMIISDSAGYIPTGDTIVSIGPNTLTITPNSATGTAVTDTIAGCNSSPWYAVSIVANSLITALASGDFNRDNIYDIAVGSSADNSVYVVPGTTTWSSYYTTCPSAALTTLNAAGNAFKFATSLAGETLLGANVVAADFQGLGYKQDLLMSASKTVYGFYGNANFNSNLAGASNVVNLNYSTPYSSSAFGSNTLVSTGTAAASGITAGTVTITVNNGALYTPGMTVSAPGILPGTYITAKSGGTGLTLSQAATVTNSATVNVYGYYGFAIDTNTNRNTTLIPGAFPVAMIAGDVNGDGLQDIVLTANTTLGASQGYATARATAGSTFVMFQPAGGWAGPYTMFDAASPATTATSWFDKYGNPTTLTTGTYYLQEFRVDGNAAADLAYTAAIGDLNGDGKPDLFIGAQGDGGGNGAVYTLWGRSPYGTNPVPWQSNNNGANGTPGVTGVIDLYTIQ